jgi:hypothetical protein
MSKLRKTQRSTSSEKDSDELEDYKATSTPVNQKKACQVSNKALIKAWIKVWLFLLFFLTLLPV